MKVLLDTSGYSELLRGHSGVLEVLRNSHDVLVPVVVLGELYSGFLQGTKKADNEAALQRFLSKPTVSIVPVTEESARRYADIDTYLRRNGRPIPRNDVWIAALAMEHGATLVSLDAHFREIPLLPILP